MDEPKNLYKPPSAEVRDHPSQKKPAPVKAVIIGVAFDQIATIGLQIVIGLIFVIQLDSQGLNEEEIQQALMSLGWDSWVRIVGVIGGCALSVAAGYICARLARVNVFRPIAVMALVDLAIAFIFNPGVPEAESLGLSLATVVCIFAGGWLWLYREQRR